PCSSAPRPSNTTSARCTESSGSRPAATSRRRCPTDDAGPADVRVRVMQGIAPRRKHHPMSTYLLVVDLRDDFAAVTNALDHYEGAAPDASFVVLVPEQEPPEMRKTEDTATRTENLHKAFAAAGMPVNVVISSRDVVDAV